MLIFQGVSHFEDPYKPITRWWFQRFFIFTPIWGKMNPFWRYNIFQRGWGWNHQLDQYEWKCQKSGFVERRISMVGTSLPPWCSQAIRKSMRLTADAMKLAEESLGFSPVVGDRPFFCLEKTRSPFNGNGGGVGWLSTEYLGCPILGRKLEVDGIQWLGNNGWFWPQGIPHWI